MNLTLDLAVLLATFAIIFPAELPDKSFIATLVLATRYPRLWVWLGASLAFGDVVETAALRRADTIKTHHNRVPIIEEMIAATLLD